MLLRPHLLWSTSYSLLWPLPSTPLDKVSLCSTLFHSIHLTLLHQAMSMQTTPQLLFLLALTAQAAPASLPTWKLYRWKEGNRLHAIYQTLPRILSPHFALVAALGLHRVCFCNSPKPFSPRKIPDSQSLWVVSLAPRLPQHTYTNIHILRKP